MFFEGFVFVGQFGQFHFISVQVVENRVLAVEELKFFFFLFFIGFDVSVVFGLLLFEFSFEDGEFSFPDFEFGLLFFVEFLGLEFFLLEEGELISELSVLVVEPFDCSLFGGGLRFSHTVDGY